MKDYNTMKIKNKNLVLDIDETLVSSSEVKIESYNFFFEVVLLS